MGRRNITDYARGELVIKVKPLIAARAKLNQQLSQGRGVKGLLNSAKVNTREELAKAADIGHDNIRKIEDIMAHGTPELKAAVRIGEVSIHAGHVATQLPPEEQNEVVARIEAGEKPTKAIKKQIPEATEKSRDVAADVKKISALAKRLQSQPAMASLITAVVSDDPGLLDDIQEIQAFLIGFNAAWNAFGGLS